MKTLLRLLILCVLLLPSLAQATVIFSEDLENHLYPNWIGGNNCITAGSPDGVACGYPRISNTLPHAGTYSLWSHYGNLSVQAGTFIDRDITSSSDVWMRFYYRTEGFTYCNGTNGCGETKHFYLIGSGHEVFFKHKGGDRRLIAAVISGTSSLCPNGSTDSQCEYWPNAGNKPLADGVWYCIEVHANGGSVGQSNGILEIYVDGTQTHQYSAVPMSATSATFTLVRHYAQNGLGDRYIDDIQVGNTRTDAGGCGSPPAVDSTPPPVPTNLTVTP